MKRLTHTKSTEHQITKLLFLLLMLCNLPKELPAQKGNNKSAEAMFRKMEYDWLMAEFKQDTATISSMMDNSFMSIGADAVGTKQQELQGIYDNIGQRKKNNHVVDALYLDDFHLKIHGNTAIVTFISVTKGSIQNTPFNNRRTRMYDVWINHSGNWKAVSSQVTPLPQK